MAVPNAIMLDARRTYPSVVVSLSVCLRQLISIKTHICLICHICHLTNKQNRQRKRWWRFWGGRPTILFKRHLTIHQERLTRMKVCLPSLLGGSKMKNKQIIKKKYRKQCPGMIFTNGWSTNLLCEESINWGTGFTWASKVFPEHKTVLRSKAQTVWRIKGTLSTFHVRRWYILYRGAKVPIMGAKVPIIYPAIIYVSTRTSHTSYPYTCVQ